MRMLVRSPRPVFAPELSTALPWTVFARTEQLHSWACFQMLWFFAGGCKASVSQGICGVSKDVLEMLHALR